MCNLYSHTAGPEAIRSLARVMHDVTGNLPPQPGIFPDFFAPIVRNAPDGERELTMARWECLRRCSLSKAGIPIPA